MIVQTLGLLGLFILTQANGAGGLFLGLASLAVLIGYNYFAGLFYGNEHPSKRGRGFASGMHQGSLAAGLAIGSIGGGLFGAYLGPRSPYFLGMLVLLASIAGQVLVIQQSRLRMNSLVDELADSSGRKR
jgi:predicted MFS family arabinose efflux permease